MSAAHGEPRRMNTPVEEFTTVFDGRRCARCQFIRKDGTQCGRPARKGRRRCRRHGGNTVTIGAAHPNYRTGRYSVLLQRLGHSGAHRDLNMLAEIDVFTARNEEIAARLATFGGTWTDFVETFRQLRAAMLTSNTDGIRDSMNALQQLADGAEEHMSLWREFERVTKRRAELVDTERRLRLAAFDTMDRQTAAAHARALIDAVVRHIHDRRTLSAILNDVKRLVE